jgi:hypothetical protein
VVYHCDERQRRSLGCTFNRDTRLQAWHDHVRAPRQQRGDNDRGQMIDFFSLTDHNQTLGTVTIPRYQSPNFKPSHAYIIRRSARGKPSTSIILLMAANPAVFSLAHASIPASATACDKAASATAEILIPDALASTIKSWGNETLTGLRLDCGGRRSAFAVGIGYHFTSCSSCSFLQFGCKSSVSPIRPSLTTQTAHQSLARPKSFY